jgi:hypothetical protein
MWSAASKPAKMKEVVSSAERKQTPSGQPVLFMKVPHTKEEEEALGVERMNTAMTEIKKRTIVIATLFAQELVLCYLD